MIRNFIFIFLAVLLFSCDSRSKLEKEIEQVPISFEVIRFDQKFASVTAETLPALKTEFPFLFPERFPDSLWLARINDTIQMELNREVEKEFIDFTAEEDKLHNLFQHLKYYFPSFKAPTVITITSEVDYKNKVLAADEFLFIALDTYLGKNHEFYLGIQHYLKKNFEREQILPDVAAEYAKKYIPQPETKTFLSHMLYYGKILYLKDILLPQTPDAAKIGYTEDEIVWARENEEQIWKYFVERQILFNSDTELYSRFLYPAPFSKFYLELDNESPAMLGQFIGWKIIKQYMDREKVSLQEMLATDAETIFTKANYKPRK
ncbi:MAG TPA: gliding motility lipoprotein GldB [Salegentibacter sp.]|nr:gliding motility lipoprotein GldB [Salegentibacter sp.]